MNTKTSKILHPPKVGQAQDTEFFKVEKGIKGSNKLLPPRKALIIKALKANLLPQVSIYRNPLLPYEP